MNVLQEWVTELPLMMQGTLLTGIRGNDLAHAPRMKPVVRWLRSLLLNNGNPQNDFMEVGQLPTVEEFDDELEYLSCHYFLHLLHTLQIVGYKHPDTKIRLIASDYYSRLVDWCHLHPEPESEMDERLSGRAGTTGSFKVWVSEWTQRNQEIEREESLRTAVIPPLHIHHGRQCS